jgi:hypothetical protein
MLKRHPSGVNDPSMGKTIAFLNDAIAPFMTNIVYNTDAVPRGYANLQFIGAFTIALFNDATSTGVVSAFLDIFVKFHRSIFKKRKSLMLQAEQYFHISKIIYYEDITSPPLICVDEGFDRQSPMHRQPETEMSFHDLVYDPPSGNVVQSAFDIHMMLVRGPGLTFV